MWRLPVSPLMTHPACGCSSEERLSRLIDVPRPGSVLGRGRPETRGVSEALGDGCRHSGAIGRSRGIKNAEVETMLLVLIGLVVSVVVVAFVGLIAFGDVAFHAPEYSAAGVSTLGR